MSCQLVQALDSYFLRRLKGPLPCPTHFSCQWRSRALKSGWAQGVSGRKSPSGVQERSPGGGLGAKLPWARYIGYKQLAAVNCFSAQVCCRVRPPSPLPLSPKNSSDLCESHDPTRPGQGAPPCPPVVTLLFPVPNMITVSHGESLYQLSRFRDDPLSRSFICLYTGLNQSCVEACIIHKQ